MVFYSRPGDDISRGLVGFWKLDDLKRIPSDGIVAHYKMNDNAADTNVVDSKGGNTGTASVNTSTLTTVGKINEALDLNGTDEFLNLESGDNLNPGASSFSIAGWFNITDDTALQFLLGKYTGASFANNAGGIGYELLYRGDFGSKQLQFRVNNGSGTGTTTSSDDAGYSDISGAWHHVVCVANRDTNRGIIYVDGVNVVNGGFDDISAQTGTYSNSGNFNVGRQTGDGTGGWMTGAVDDLRYYDRALSSSEIATIYNSDLGTETTELFRQNIVAIDRANFNDGTISGATNTEGINGVSPDAMFFDGVDDSVITTKSISSDNGTINIWCKPDSILVAPQPLFTSDDDDISVFKASNNDWGFILYGSFITIRDINIRIDVLSMITVTWQKVGANFDYKVYNNGILQFETLESITSGDSGNFTIGARPGADTFPGMLAKFRIYDRALTKGEISKLFRLKL